MSAIEQLYNEIRAYKRSRIIATAIHFGILSALRNHGAGASLLDLAAVLQMAPNWLAAVLNILCRCGLVIAEGHSYSLTEMGRKADTDSALRAFAGYHFHCFNSWSSLPEALMSGKAIYFHRERIQDKDFCRSYLKSMDAIAESHAEFLEQECGSLLIGRVLDIGAGPSSLCRRLAQRDENRAVTAIDFREIVLLAKELFEVRANFNWIAGDFLQWNPQNQFDAAYCGHLLEYCPRSELPVWLGKIRSFIKDTGYLVLVVFLRDTSNEAGEDLDLFEISTGLNGTNLGDILTPKEIVDILQGAGFEIVEIKPLPEGPSYSEYLVTCQASQQKEALRT